MYKANIYQTHYFIYFFNLKPSNYYFFFFNDTATTEIYTLSLHRRSSDLLRGGLHRLLVGPHLAERLLIGDVRHGEDRKSTRLNSSHEWKSYAVFCLKK